MAPSVTATKSYSSPTGLASDVISEEGIRYRDVTVETTPHKFESVRKRFAFIRYLVPGEEQERYLERSISDAQFTEFAGKLEALLLGAAAVEMGIEVKK
jgi:hypothetical protein